MFTIHYYCFSLVGLSISRSALSYQCSTSAEIGDLETKNDDIQPITVQELKSIINAYILWNKCCLEVDIGIFIVKPVTLQKVYNNIKH